MQHVKCRSVLDHQSATVPRSRDVKPSAALILSEGKTMVSVIKSSRVGLFKLTHEPIGCRDMICVLWSQPLIYGWAAASHRGLKAEHSSLSADSLRRQLRHRGGMRTPLRGGRRQAGVGGAAG